VIPHRATSTWLGLVTALLLAPALALAHPVAHRLQLAPTGEGAGDQFGIIVGGPGDLNGDGYADFVVDGFLNDFAGLDAGRAYVYFGGPALDVVADLVLTGAAVGDNFGVAKGAGDVDGDGHPDLIVGANQAGSYPNNPGKAYLYLGGPAMDGVPDLTLVGEASGDLFGSRVASAGDVNADGYGDFIVGAIGNAEHGVRTGRAYLYFGGPLLDAVPDIVFTGEMAGDEFGLVGPAGDIDGDGFDDLIVGAWLANAGGNDAGRAYLFFGGPGMDAEPDLVLTGVEVYDRFGVSVMGTGDVSGDGFADVIVGAYWNDAAGPDAGRAYVYFGGPALDDVPDVTLTGEAAGDGFGKSVCDAGDVNGDGFADVIVGAYTSDAGGYNSGRAYVFFGGPAMDSVPDMTLTGEWEGDQMGYWVSSTGDVNQDGFPDVLIGASFNDAGAHDAGRAYLIDFNRYFVESPNGGETWSAGGTASVSWRGAEPADVWLSLDGGAHWERVASGVGGAESNAVKIAVPDQASVLATIRITASDAGVEGEDRSDAPFRIERLVGVGDPGAPAAMLAPPWPNPAREATRLAIELPVEDLVTVRVYDTAGRLVATPIAERLPPGPTVRIWAPGALPRGVYQVWARIGTTERVRKLVWLGD